MFIIVELKLQTLCNFTFIKDEKKGGVSPLFFGKKPL